MVNLVIALGLLITILSFVQYLGQDTEGLQVSGLGFVYGIPIFLAGAALKYAEIAPVPCLSTPSANAAFEKYATEIMKKVKQDVTRHRYGNEAHLDTTIKKLGLVVPGKSYPQLQEPGATSRGNQRRTVPIYHGMAKLRHTLQDVV